jgi:hypothetical protein
MNKQIILEKYIKVAVKKALKEQEEQQKRAEKALYLVYRFPGLKKLMEDLMSPAFGRYIGHIEIVAPKPTTFDVKLINGQDFNIIYAGKGNFTVKISGKKYNPNSLGELERASQSIADLLQLNYAPEEGKEQQQSSSEAGIKSDLEQGAKEIPPAEEKPAEEETPVAEGVKKKVNVIEEIMKEFSIKPKKSTISEAEIGSVLTSTFKDNIPKPSFTPTLGENFNLSGEDARVFAELFEKTPSKSNGDTQTKGSGNGEVSVYWLFSQSGHNVVDERGSDKPDLKIDNIGVEVKAYDSSVVTLGKFAKDKESLRLLNIVFGFKALVSTLEGNKKEANPANFTDKDLVQAFDLMFEFSKNEELRTMAEKNGFNIITELYNKINNVKSSLNLQSDDSKAAAAAILRQLAINKLERKPGIPGYILNVKKNGIGVFHKITKEAVENASDATILDSIKINQAQIDMNFQKIFG